MKKKFVVILNLIFLAFISCSKSPHNENMVVFQIDDPDLIPEGIAYSEKTNSFYLSSIHKSKIISIDQASAQTKDFISSGAYNFLPGMGLLVDDLNNNLWAIASDIENGKGDSRIFKFDLLSAKLKNTYHPADSNKHFLNDLALTEDGRLYISDSDNHTIYELDNHGQLTVFLQSHEIEYPNGICYSKSTKHLFVASFTKGIRIIDVTNKQIINAPDSTDLTRGIDGLKYVNNTLVGIQNGYQTKEKHKIVQFKLDQMESAVIDSCIIAQNNPYFDTPTTCVVKKNQVFCIANSQLSKLDQSINRIIAGKKTDPVYILKFDLKPTL